MVNSSPEYSITKPGLHLLRKRDKPLRTYGRQPSTPEAQSEPPLKKRRLPALAKQQRQHNQQDEKPSSAPDSSGDAPEPEATPITPSSETNTNHDAPNQTKPDTARAPSTKGSILSYFKPAPAPALPKPKVESSSQDSQSQPEDEPSAPPESPPKQKQPSRRRKPRLLRIKPVTHDDPLDESPQEPDESPPPAQPPLKTTTHNALAKAARQPAETQSSPTPSPPSLSPRKTSLRTHQKPTSTTKKPSSSSSSPAVQTTLNISARAAFSECKVCDTLWNPLYPDDVKFHDKTHRAVLRAQRKRQMAEL